VPFTIKTIIIISISILLGFMNSVRSFVPFFTPEKIPYVKVQIEKRKQLPEGITALSLKEAYEIFKKNTRIFIDARLPKSYKEDHIEGAENLSLSNIDDNLTQFMDQYPFETALLLYCGSIHCDSSTRLAAKLKKVGYKDIKVFLGGWAEWRDQILKK